MRNSRERISHVSDAFRASLGLERSRQKSNLLPNPEFELLEWQQMAIDGFLETFQFSEEYLYRTVESVDNVIAHLNEFRAKPEWHVHLPTVATLHNDLQDTALPTLSDLLSSALFEQLVKHRRNCLTLAWDEAFDNVFLAGNQHPRFKLPITTQLPKYDDRGLPIRYDLQGMSTAFFEQAVREIPQETDDSLKNFQGSSLLVGMVIFIASRVISEQYPALKTNPDLLLEALVETVHFMKIRGVTFRPVLRDTSATLTDHVVGTKQNPGLGWGDYKKMRIQYDRAIYGKKEELDQRFEAIPMMPFLQTQAGMPSHSLWSRFMREVEQRGLNWEVVKKVAVARAKMDDELLPFLTKLRAVKHNMYLQQDFSIYYEAASAYNTAYHEANSAYKRRVQDIFAIHADNKPVLQDCENIVLQLWKTAEFYTSK